MGHVVMGRRLRHNRDVTRLPAVVCIVALLASWGCEKHKADSVRLYNEGMKAFSQGDYRQAHKWFTDAISAHPENAEAYYGLGLVKIKLHRLEQAREHLIVATRLKPELIEGAYQLGWIALERKKVAEAKENLLRVIQKEPDHAPAHYLLGLAYERGGELEKANDAFRKAVTLDPEQMEAFVALERLYLRVGAEAEAKAVIEEGLRVARLSNRNTAAEQSVLLNDLGLLQMETGEYPAAIQALLKAIELDNSRVDAVFNLGCAYASHGQYELAHRYFNQYIGIADRNSDSAMLAREAARHLEERMREKTPPPHGKSGT